MVVIVLNSPHYALFLDIMHLFISVSRLLHINEDTKMIIDYPVIYFTVALRIRKDYVVNNGIRGEDRCES